MSGTERDCEHKYVNIKHTKRSSVIENTTFAHKQKNSISLLNPSQCIKKKGRQEKVRRDVIQKASGKVDVMF